MYQTAVLIELYAVRTTKYLTTQKVTGWVKRAGREKAGRSLAKAFIISCNYWCSISYARLLIAIGGDRQSKDVKM